MDQSFIRAVVQVCEVLFEGVRERGGIDGVSVVLRRDMAFARAEVEGRDVVRAVAIFHLRRLCAGGNGEELVSEADTHDGDL